MTPSIRIVGHGEPIPRGYVRRPRPVWVEFVKHANWWPNQIHQRNGQEEGMVYLWIPRKDNAAYERGHKRTRFCLTYQGKSCQHITGRVNVVPKC